MDEYRNAPEWFGVVDKIADDIAKQIVLMQKGKIPDVLKYYENARFDIVQLVLEKDDYEGIIIRCRENSEFEPNSRYSIYDTTTQESLRTIRNSARKRIAEYNAVWEKIESDYPYIRGILKDTEVDAWKVSNDMISFAFAHGDNPKALVDLTMETNEKGDIVPSVRYLLRNREQVAIEVAEKIKLNHRGFDRQAAQNVSAKELAALIAVIDEYSSHCWNEKERVSVVDAIKRGCVSLSKISRVRSALEKTRQHKLGKAKGLREVRGVI